MSGGAWCNTRHDRAGLVGNQDPREPYNPNEPMHSVATCDRQECIAKAIKLVAGETNRTAAFVADGWQKSGPLAVTR